MKKIVLLSFLVALGCFVCTSCEKDEPAEDISGNYTGVMSGTYDGNDTLITNYTVAVSALSKNEVSVSGDIFPSFKVLVTQKGLNVKPVATDNEVVAFLYEGDLKELSFEYHKNGNIFNYSGTKQ
ncbi:MAG: hypothetical protein WDZ35_07205 [Crocinitomicaceae bacterium]